MPITYTAFHGSPTGALHQRTHTHPDLLPHQALIKILYSGVCGTDAHIRHTPAPLDHEGVGIITAFGSSAATAFAINDRVGIGYVRGGCGSCRECQLGYNFHCKVAPDNYGMEGSCSTWASHAILPTTRLAKIPEGIASEVAGPLMCAGQTVWLPFARGGGIRGWETVGVVGVGGLGHLAVQFAAKMGCKVVVFSGSEGKREEAMRLGASEFWTVEELKKGGPGESKEGFVDHLLVTTSQMPDWGLYLPILANRAHIYPLTISTDDFKMNQLAMITKEITVKVLCASTMVQVNQMLDFVARHQIKPIVEEFPMTLEGIEEAMAKLERGEMRYRGVLKA